MSREKMKTKDIVTAAVMMSLFYVVAFVVGAGTVAIPIVYLYMAAGIEMFLGSIFYLVAANRINKNGLLFVWVMVYAVITALMGYLFMLPYFIIVALVCEVVMIGKDSYRKPLRNIIGWSVYGIGMILGAAIPCIFAWESYKEQAISGGFSVETIDLQLQMVSSPWLMLVGVAITVVLSILGIIVSQRILKKHFKKAGILN